MFVLPVYLKRIPVKFVHKGHRVKVKVKVTGAQKSIKAILAMQNFDQQ